MKIEEIILKSKDGKILASSREIAERFEKEHKHVLRDIKNLTAQNWTVKNMFIESKYENSRGRIYPEYLLDRDGFSLLVMGFTGDKALEWKIKYIDAFNKMENRLKEQNSRLLPGSYKEALLQLIQQIEDNERLLDEVDRYTRFLCDKTELLKKSELATKLDTNPVTLASLLKKLNIYTPKNCKLTESFLEKFPDVKMFNESDESYTDKKTGELVIKKGWQWTFLGAKNLVDHLIELGYVTFTENNGFKLKKA